jgi:hypothetical protein
MLFKIEYKVVKKILKSYRINILNEKKLLLSYLTWNVLINSFKNERQ